MVVVAQLVRASVCGTEGRGFESHHPPIKKGLVFTRPFFVSIHNSYFLLKFINSLLNCAGF